MKFIAARFLAALSALAALSFTASASLPYSAGDLLLGVRAAADPGGTQDLVVDLGPASQFTQATSTVALPSLGADLGAFSTSGGAAWSSRADVFWGIVGTDNAADPSNTLYVTRPRTDPATRSTPWSRRSGSSQSGTNSTFHAFISGYLLSSANASNSQATFQSDASSNSYASFTSGGSDFGDFGNIEGAFANGTAGSVLDLYRLAPTSQNSTGSGLLYVGSFQFSDAGTLTFTPAAASQPLFSLSTVGTVQEDAGSIAVHVQRRGVTSGTDTVTLATTDGTAKAGTDYTAVNTQVQFAPGDTTHDVLIPITLVAGAQKSRVFTLALSSPSAGEVDSPSAASVTITDTTPFSYGAIAFSGAATSVSSVDATASPNVVTVTLLRTGGTDGPVSVDVASAAGGTLASGTDFTGLGTPSTVQFASGDASKSLVLQLAALPDAKLPGTIKLTLSNPQGGATLGSLTTLTVTVTPRDKVRPLLAVTTRSGVTTSGTFAVAGITGDNVAIDRVEVRVNGGAVQRATLGTPAANGALTFNLAGLALENGGNVISITPVDSSGNAGATSTVRVLYYNVRPALAGVYNGLITPAGTPSVATTGYVNLAVTSTGLFTGRVYVGPAVFVVRGIIDNAGTAHFNVTSTTTAAPTTLALSTRLGAVTAPYGALSLATSQDKVTGTLLDGSTNVLATISTDRAFFDGRTAATTVDASYLAHGGVYTVQIPARATETGLTSSQYPQGTGYGLLKVTAGGTVTLLAALADGSVISEAAPLSKTYSWPLYARLATTAGLISGPVQFDQTQTESDLEGQNLLWFRPARAASPYYPAGWPAGIQIDLFGAHYAVTPGTSVLPGLGADDLVNGNAELTFTDGKLAASITKHLNVSAQNRIIQTPVDRSYSLALTPSYGVISGRFTHTDGTFPLFHGIIYQKGQNAAAYGYFLSTVPRGATTGESGEVILSHR